MNNIIKMQFGSVVYGTNLPASDTDIKYLFIPGAKSLVMQKPVSVLVEKMKLSSGEKNNQEDTDIEGFSLQTYLRHLTNGQTFAVDLLFTPEHNYIERGPAFSVWETIKENKHRLLTKQVQGFVGYCAAQSSKYGVKGARLKSAEDAVKFLDDCITTCGPREHLSFVSKELVKFCDSPFVKFESVANPRTHHEEVYLEVCGRKAQLNISIIDALKMFKGIVDNYGKRAEAAREGMDEKASYHALRIACEAEELLLTGRITFPRPEKETLLKIRRKELYKEEVEQLIENKIRDVELSVIKSTLPDEPDYGFIEDLIYETHLKEIMNGI